MNVIPNVLLWLDDCNSHVHHRGKLLLPGMKNHTLKLCSQARHSKTDTTLTTCITRLENRAALLITRVVGPAPDPRTLPASLIIGINILVQPEMKHHNRTRGQKKQYVTDAVELGDFFNGNLDDGLVHHCWNAETQRPCCGNIRETKATGTRLLVNCCCVRTDNIPAESTWAHAVNLMEVNVLRRLPKRISLDAVGDPPNS